MPSRSVSTPTSHEAPFISKALICVASTAAPLFKRKKDGSFETKTETKEEQVSGGVVGIKEKDMKSDKESEPEISVSFEVISVKQDKNTPASRLWDNAKPSITVKMP